MIMVDLIALGVIVLLVATAFIKKANTAMAILALLSGVLIDQLLSTWLIDAISRYSETQAGVYLAVCVHLILVFGLSFVVLARSKSYGTPVVRLAGSLVFAVLTVYFGADILSQLPEISDLINSSRALLILLEYEKVIYIVAPLAALAEIMLGGKPKINKKDSK